MSKKNYSAVDLIESITIKSEKNVKLTIFPMKYEYIKGRTVITKFNSKLDVTDEIHKPKKFTMMRRLNKFINKVNTKEDVILATSLLAKNKGFDISITVLPTKIDKNAIEYIKEVFD